MKMTKKNHRHVFTSESVSEGHPDKVADQISDAILDACLTKDKGAHVACETTVGPDVVVNVGEITCKDFKKIDTEAIARRVAKKIGYTIPEEHFADTTFKYYNFLHGQSPNIIPWSPAPCFSFFRRETPWLMSGDWPWRKL